LVENKTSFTSGLSMAANLPMGTSLKIIIRSTSNSSTWAIRFMPNGPVNWNFTPYDFASMSQEFTATAPGSNSDLYIEFTPGNYSIEYYENNSITPTRVKTIVF
jgi:hypothetical protein